jgi:TonB family protein
VQQAPALAGPIVDHVSPELLPILRRALAKDREQRYPTMRAFMADLRRVHTTALAKGTATYPREGSSSGRRRELYALLAGLALGGAALLLSEFLRGEGRPAPTGTAPALGPAPSPSTSAGFSPSPALSPRPGEAVEPDAPPVCERCPVSYPKALEKAGIEGTVQVRVRVSDQGLVEEAEVVGTVRRELREAALDTVRKWIYRPGTRAGVPAGMDLVASVTFRRPNG